MHLYTKNGAKEYHEGDRWHESELHEGFQFSSNKTTNWLLWAGLAVLVIALCYGVWRWRRSLYHDEVYNRIR